MTKREATMLGMQRKLMIVITRKKESIKSVQKKLK
jgi:hypothetical protein